MPDTLATPSNMRAFEEANPARQLPNGATILGRSCFAWSPVTGEQYSATAGDYFAQPDDEPLRDSEGQPMILAVTRTQFFDALTDEPI
jgi:hypothetical protein